MDVRLFFLFSERQQNKIVKENYVYTCWQKQVTETHCNKQPKTSLAVSFAIIYLRQDISGYLQLRVNWRYMRYLLIATGTGTRKCLIHENTVLKTMLFFFLIFHYSCNHNQKQLRTRISVLPKEGEEAGQLLDGVLQQTFVVHHVQRRLSKMQAVQSQVHPLPHLPMYMVVEPFTGKNCNKHLNYWSEKNEAKFRKFQGITNAGKVQGVDG